MRLSVNLDPQLYEQLRALAYTERTTISAVINRLAQSGLAGSAPISASPSTSSGRFPISAGIPGKVLTSEMVASAEDEAEAPGRFMVNERPSS